MDTLQAIAGFAGSLAALIVAVVSLLQLRKSGDDAEGRQPIAQRAFNWLTRPVPILVGLAVMAVVSVSLLLQLRASDSKPPPTAVRLLTHLVGKEAHGCRQVAATSPAIAALSCNLRKPMSSLRISLFPSVSELKREIEDRRGRSGLAEGSCSSRRLAWEKWSSGVLICDYGGAGVKPLLQWSRHDSQVLLEAEARPGVDADDIYEWWQQESNGAPANNRLRFPDGIEEFILDRTNLEITDCGRGSDFKGSAGAVLCTYPGVEQVYVGYYDKQSLLAKALGQKPGAGSCTNGRIERGRDTYAVDGVVVGTRDCYNDDGDDDRRSVIEWTNRSSHLYAYAWAKLDEGEDSLNRLFIWWERRGRRVTD